MGKKQEEDGAMFEKVKEEETPAAALEPSAEEADDFDYKGTLESLKDDPVFQRRFLGEGEEIDKEEFARLLFEAAIEAEGDDDAAIQAMVGIMDEKLDDVSDSHLSRKYKEREEEEKSREERRSLRKKLQELGEIDDSYKFDFGDTPDDVIPLDDSAFAASPMGKFAAYLADEGYSARQINNITKDILYAMSSDVNGHDNKLLLGLATKPSTRPAVVKSSVVASSGDGDEKMLRDLFTDKEAWNKEVDRSLEGKDKKRYEELKNYEKSVLRGA